MNEQKQEQEQEQPAAPALDSGLLTAAEILGADDLDFVDVPVPEWTPGYVKPKPGEEEDEAQIVKAIRLRTLTAGESIDFAEASPQAKMDRIVALVARCATDENGEPLFTEQQAKQLRTKSWPVWSRIQTAFLVLNGLAEEDDAGDATEAEKND